MNTVLVRAVLLSAVAVAGTLTIASCSSSSTSPDSLSTDAGPGTVPDSGSPVDSGAPTGACATECKTELCASKAPTSGGACESCLSKSLDTGGACVDAVNHGCAAFADCVALDACIVQCSADAGTVDAGASDQACKAADGGVSGCEDCCYAHHPDGVKEAQAALLACACGQ